MRSSVKPIFAILPSPVTAKYEMDGFRTEGIPYFTDEAEFADALARWYRSVRAGVHYAPASYGSYTNVREQALALIGPHPDGYLPQDVCDSLLDLFNIPRAATHTAATLDEAARAADLLGYPVVMKVRGPLHKSDLGGVVRDLDRSDIAHWFRRFMAIPGADGVILQRRLSGDELFIGAMYEEGFGHLVFCGLGGVFIEVLNDTASALHPITKEEAEYMVGSLRGHDLFKGVRGRCPISMETYVSLIVAVSDMLAAVPEVMELDINPILADGETMAVVDIRIRVARS